MKYYAEKLRVDNKKIFSCLYIKSQLESLTLNVKMIFSNDNFLIRKINYIYFCNKLKYEKIRCKEISLIIGTERLWENSMRE